MKSTHTAIEESPDKRYKKFDCLIGTGTFKKVYLGFDVAEGRDVAWSDLSLEETTEEELEQFNNEVEILRSVNCEYIIHYYDSWDDKKYNKKVIITQYHPSGTILEYTKNKVISLEGIKKWAIQILHGLDYLHSRTPPIIHKDLKCSNLFIDGIVSAVRIGDLGLASHSNRSSPIAGTLEYMAPEIIDKNIYNEKTDMYAFGMCLLELITKNPPYHECATMGELITKVLAGILPAAIEEVKDEGFKSLILQLLGKPEERPSAKELLENSFFTSVSDTSQSSPLSELDQARPNYPSLYLTLTKNQNERETDGDTICFTILRQEESSFQIRVIRKYENTLIPAVRLDFDFVYGVDQVERFVSSLVKMNVVPEIAIEEVTHSIEKWIHDYLVKQFY